MPQTRTPHTAARHGNQLTNINPPFHNRAPTHNTMLGPAKHKRPDHSSINSSSDQTRLLDQAKYKLPVQPMVKSMASFNNNK